MHILFCVCVGEGVGEEQGSVRTAFYGLVHTSSYATDIFYSEKRRLGAAKIVLTPEALVMTFDTHNTYRLPGHLALKILHKQMFSDKHVL